MICTKNYENVANTVFNNNFKILIYLNTKRISLKRLGFSVHQETECFNRVQIKTMIRNSVCMADQERNEGVAS